MTPKMTAPAERRSRVRVIAFVMSVDRLEECTDCGKGRDVLIIVMVLGATSDEAINML